MRGVQTEGNSQSKAEGFALVPRQTAIPRKRRQAFNAKPRRGCKLPAQGKRAQRATPWVLSRRKRYAPGGGKSHGRNASVVAFAPFGGASEIRPRNPGCRSLRSLALGWELVAPSGRALNAWHPAMNASGRALNASCATGGRVPAQKPFGPGGGFNN